MSRIKLFLAGIILLVILVGLAGFFGYEQGQDSGREEMFSRLEKGVAFYIPEHLPGGVERVTFSVINYGDGYSHPHLLINYRDGAGSAMATGWPSDKP